MYTALFKGMGYLGRLRSNVGGSDLAFTKLVTSILRILYLCECDGGNALPYSLCTNFHKGMSRLGRVNIFPFLLYSRKFTACIPSVR